MAIIKAPDRAPNASLGMIDYSTTARLGEKGIDLVTEAVQRKQAEDKLKYETAKAERKQAQVNLASFDAKVEANPDLLEFIQTDDGVLGKAFDSYESGKMNYQDSLILSGGADSYIAQKQVKQQTDLASLQLQSIQKAEKDKEIVGKAIGASYVTLDDGTQVYDPSKGIEYINRTAPELAGTFAQQSLQIETQQQNIEASKTAENISYLQLNLEENKLNLEKDITTKERTDRVALQTVFQNAILSQRTTGESISTGDALLMYNLAGGTDVKALNEAINNAPEGTFTKIDPEVEREIKKEIENQKMGNASTLTSTITSSLQAGMAGKNIVEEQVGAVNPFRVGAFARMTWISRGAVDSKGKFDVLTSKQALDQIKELRSEITGATGLGQVSIREFDSLMSYMEGVADLQFSSDANIIEVTNRLVYQRYRASVAQFYAYMDKYDMDYNEAMGTLGVGNDSIQTMVDYMDVYETKNAGIISELGGSYIDLMSKQYFNSEDIIEANKGKKNDYNEMFDYLGSANPTVVAGNTGINYEDLVGNYKDQVGYGTVLKPQSNLITDNPFAPQGNVQPSARYEVLPTYPE
jgi:hypothetical protein